jgi:hypothetical protein
MGDQFQEGLRLGIVAGQGSTGSIEAQRGKCCINNSSCTEAARGRMTDHIWLKALARRLSLPRTQSRVGQSRWNECEQRACCMELDRVAQPFFCPWQTRNLSYHALNLSLREKGIAAWI